MGIWFVYDPNTSRSGPGAFAVNGQIRSKAFRDGMSKTLMLSEVKTFSPYFRNSGAATATVPTDPSAICGFAGQAKMGPTLQKNTGHTEWADGKTQQTGFTTVFGPNTPIICTQGGVEYDVDFTNYREGTDLTKITYAAVPARSHHAGLVNTALMDGSVRSFADDIELQTWQALSTRDGGEMISQNY
jgi:hypothetical protein